MAAGSETVFGLDVAALKAKIERQPWASAVYRRVRERVAEWQRRGIRIPGPEEESGWWHNFTCPDCAVLLDYDPDSPTAHRCSHCGGVFSDVNQNAAWIYRRNLDQIHAAEDACLVAAVDNDRSGLDLARTALLGYAERYPEYREHGRWAGVGRVQGQSLCEAVWLVPAVRVFQSLRDADCLTDAEREKIVEGMFLPAAAMLQRQTSAIHNIHVWHCAAIFAIGEAAGSRELRAFAEAHLRRNLREGVLPDGSWYEGSPHYHFYTIEAFSRYALAARGAGREIVEAHCLQRMLRSPLLMLQPDGQLPAFNDGWPENPLARRGPAYEVGQYLFGGFEDALHTIYDRFGGERTSVEALLYGPETIASAALVLPRLAHVDGVAVVRRGPLVGYIKATPHGGGHDHPDKPGLYLLSTRGGPEAVDIGNPGYGNPMHRAYYRRTISHNTVMVDGRDQSLGPARITELKDEGRFTRASAATDAAYDGITISRTTLFGDGWALDWTRAASDDEHEYLWLFHASGSLRLDGAGEGIERIFIDNPHVEAQRAFTPGGPVAGNWETPESRGRLAVKVWLPEEQAAFVGTARMPDLPATDTVDLLAVGARGRTFDTVALFAVNDAEPPHVAVRERTPERLVVEIDADGTPFVVELGGAA